MIAYMKRHERYVLERLATGMEPESRRELGQYHERQIWRMQHERLIHLLVTLAVCLFALLALGMAIVQPVLPVLTLLFLLVILAAAYLIHYYRLENGVQRWYVLADRIAGREP